MRIATVVGLVLLLTVPSLAEEPKLADLAAAGKAAAARLPKEAVRWTARHQMNQMVAEVDVVGKAGKWRREFFFIVQGRRIMAGRIIERDGFWYVEDEAGLRKHRPHEAVLTADALYIFYDLADLRFIVDTGVEMGKFARLERGRAVYQVELAPAQHAQLAKAKRTYEELDAQSPGILQRPDVKQNYENITRMLEHGLENEVDVKNGFFAGFGDMTRRTRITSFEWLADAPAGAFDIDDKKWTDKTANLLAGDLNDLAMLNHDPLWRPGRQAAPGVVFANLRTKTARRIPTSIPLAGGGCFTRDRKRAIVSVIDMFSSGIMTLAEVDLATGDTRLLGGDLGQKGHTLMPALSPDGKTVAALHMTPDAPMLHSQVVLIDLESGDARPLGKPIDTAYLSWLPDQSGLILIHREHRKGEQFTLDSVARMDMKGQLKILRRGDEPLVLPKQKAILFREDGTEDRLWKLCDLDGGNMRPFADGLKGFGTASLRPDGKHLLMSKFAPETGPVPHIVEIATGKATAIDMGTGFWGNAER